MAADQTAADRTWPGLAAQNFLRVLSLIDRTILARRVFLSNGSAKLVLVIARQAASLEIPRPDGPFHALESMAAAITGFCTAGRAITYRMEPASHAPAGHAAIAIVNAQDPAAGGTQPRGAPRYCFGKDGWPLEAPPQASFAALEAAALIARTMASWQGFHPQGAGPALVVAVADGLAQEMSVCVEGGFTLTTTPPAQLGQIVSRWRHHIEGAENAPDRPARP